jgi:hypothetical protein
MDYGAKAAAYVDAFMQNIHWDNLAKRYASIRHRRSRFANAVGEYNPGMPSRSHPRRERRAREEQTHDNQ